MSLDEWERAFVGAGAAAVAALIGLVRRSDMLRMDKLELENRARIERIEDKHDRLESRMLGEISTLRRESTERHAELVGLILNQRIDRSIDRRKDE